MNIILEKIFTKAFLVTIARYALVAVGAWLASNTGFDPGTWETISGAILVIVTAVAGGAEATKDKVTYKGESTEISKLDPAVQKEVKQEVKVTPNRSVLDILFGK